jgi:hypothetical protein
MSISSIDQILDEMAGAAPEARLSAHETLSKIRRVVDTIPPVSLLIKPVVLPNHQSSLLLIH